MMMCGYFYTTRRLSFCSAAVSPVLLYTCLTEGLIVVLMYHRIAIEVLKEVKGRLE